MINAYLIHLTSLTFGPNSLKNVGDGFMQRAYLSGLSSLAFPAGAWDTFGDNFMLAIVFADGVVPTGLPSLCSIIGVICDAGVLHITSALQTIGDGFGAGRNRTQGITSIVVDTGAAETVGNDFLSHLDLSTITSFTIADGSLQTVGDSFMA